MVAAVLSVASCAALVHPRDPALVVLVPLALVAAMAVATTAAAWPVCRPWLSSGGRWFAGHIARAIASYGAANLVVGVSSAASLIAVGRHYLAAGDLDTAGRIAALIWLGEPLAAALAAGHQASTYPAYAAARGPAAAAVLTRGLHGLVIVAAPTLATLALSAGPLVVLVFSPAFADISGLVAMQLLATYARSATFVLGIPLMARGRLALVTTLHLLWAVGLAAGAIGWAAPGVAGASAFVIASLVANAGYLVIQGVALHACAMGPSRSDLAWLAAGAAPLALLAAF
jgi:hypothetical protein